MGAHPWFYFVPYDKDVTKAMEALRLREFQAGRYNPVERFVRFPIDPRHAPGAKHPSIMAARQDAGANGTRSILDIERIGAKPGFGTASPLDDDELMEMFSTLKPTRA